jgi:hypothetical protein
MLVGRSSKILVMISLFDTLGFVVDAFAPNYWPSHQTTLGEERSNVLIEVNSSWLFAQF